MNLNEYQGKKILHSFVIKVPKGIVVETPELAVLAAEKIYNKTYTKIWVVKAQIKAGGRGKAGGVKIAKSLKDVNKKSAYILGIYLVTVQTSKKGKLVRNILIEQYVYLLGKSYTKEYYISGLIDRYKEKTVIIYSLNGGINIEEVAKNEQEKIFIEEIDFHYGIHKFQIRKIAFTGTFTFNFNFNLELELELEIEIESKQFTELLSSFYKAYKSSNASLIEINPLLKTSDNKIMAVDAKVVLDNNACYKHMNYLYMRYLEEDAMEVVAIKAGFNFVKLYGNVGCLVNGAGLAMATMDIIKLSGGKPANFLDIGGMADLYIVEKAIKLLLQDENVSVIFINIFGGIVRCDLVAQGIIRAYQCELSVTVPFIFRLNGTNDKKAKKLMYEIGLKGFSVITLQQASEKINEVLYLYNFP